MYKFRLIIFLLVHSLVCFLQAQQSSYIHFNVNNGLPSNNAYYITQDKNGYFWISTDKGVVKFNGYHFTIYTTNDGLSDNEIFDVYEDSSNRIWFACYNGELPYFKNDTFYNRYNHISLSKLSRFNIGLKVMSDYNNSIFYLSQRATATIKKNGTIEEIFTNEISANSTLIKNSKKEVLSISYDTTNVYLTNLTTNKIKSFSHQKKKLMPLLNTKAEIIENILFYSVSENLIIKNLSDLNITETAAFESMIQYIKKVSDSLLWIGTQKGLYLFDCKNKIIVKKLFSEYSISCVFEDNENHTWVSTLDNGIFLVLNQNVELLNQHNGLNFNSCLNFTRINENTLSIGSNKFKLALIENNKVKNITLSESQGNGLIRSVKCDNQGNLYIVTAVNVYKLNKEGVNIKTYKTAIRDLLFTKNDSLYVARINGVSKIKVKDLDEHSNNLDGFLFRNINFKHGTNYFYESEAGTIYCIGNNGIKQLNGKRNEIIERDTLFKNNITSVTETRDGVIFISSDINGIKAVYKNKSTYLNNKSGLPSNFVTCLTLDDKNNLWAGTTNGLVKISYNHTDSGLKFIVKNYTTINGLIDNSINDVAIHNSKIWLATNFGVCSFKESDLIKISKSPKINIVSISINDSLYNSHNNTVVSAFNKNNFKIKYVGISSGSLNNIIYRYRMHGLEENWNTTNNIQLQYPSLPPGNYIFEILAINKNGQASGAKKIFITITPAYYQTIWFKILVAVIITLLIAFIVILRIRIWRKNHQLKENLLSSENKRLALEKEEINMQMKLIELEQKALRLHMNPHFIFNAINSISGFYASGDAEVGKKYINKLSQLLRMLLDFSSQKFISLQQEVNLLTNYFSLNQLRFQNKFNYIIDIDTKINTERLAIPPMIIQPFVENSLIHGIASLKSIGNIKVKISLEDGFLLCEIIDNGIGIKKSREINKDRIHKSTGIKITEERIRTNYNGSLSGLEICEINDENGNCLGTHVYLRLNIEELY